MSLKSHISTVFNQIRSRIGGQIGTYSGTEHVQQPETVGQKRPSRRSSGGRKPKSFDITEAKRMRALGWSYRRIAWDMRVAKETVRTRLLEDAAVPMREPIPPIEPPRPVPQPSPLPVAPEPATPMAIAPVVSPPEPFGFESISAGTKVFFLVHGDLNQQLAHNCAQPAIGIEQWHHDYASLPAFQAVERVWVVLNSSEDNRAFLQSIVDDIWIREKCRLSVGSYAGTPWVQAVAKWRLLMQREINGPWYSFHTESFEQCHSFRPLPQPNHTQIIEALLKKPKSPEKPSSVGSIDPWPLPSGSQWNDW